MFWNIALIYTLIGRRPILHTAKYRDLDEVERRMDSVLLLQ